MAKFINGIINGEIKYIKLDVRIPGRFTIDVNEDGSWTCVRERYDEEWRREHFKISYNQGFIDGCKSYENNHKED